MGLHRLFRRPVLLHRDFVTFGSLELPISSPCRLLYRCRKSTLYTLMNVKLISILDAAIIFGLDTSLVQRGLVPKRYKRSVYDQLQSSRYTIRYLASRTGALFPSCSVSLGYRYFLLLYLCFAEVTVLQ
jgi:hypothetical protein